MDSISVEHWGGVVFLIFSLVSVQRRENVAAGCWVFPVLDLVISLFNMFLGFLCLPPCQVYIIFYFVLNLFFNLQVFDMG